MVEGQEFKGKSFEGIVEIFLMWQPFDEAITTAWMFCVSARGMGEIRIPSAQHNSEYAEYLLHKGYNKDEVLQVTGISKCTLNRIIANMQNTPRNEQQNSGQ